MSSDLFEHVIVFTPKPLRKPRHEYEPELYGPRLPFTLAPLPGEVHDPEFAYKTEFPSKTGFPHGSLGTVERCEFVAKYQNKEEWWFPLRCHELKLQIQARLKIIHEGFDLACVFFSRYFEKTKTYEEIKEEVKLDVSNDQYKDKAALIEFYKKKIAASRQKGYSIILNAIKLATFYVMLVEEKIEENEFFQMEDEGYSLKNEMCYQRRSDIYKLLPIMEHHVSDVVAAVYRVGEYSFLGCQKIRAHNNASKGGKRRSEKTYQPIKDEVAKLLKSEELRPVLGWKTKINVGKILTDPIEKFQQELYQGESQPIAYENIETNIVRWLSKDKNIKEIFEKNKNIEPLNK